MSDEGSGAGGVSECGKPTQDGWEPCEIYQAGQLVVRRAPKTGLARLWAKLTGGELTVSETWVAK